MKHPQLTPLEVVVATETIDEGLKRAHITYATPIGYNLTDLEEVLHGEVIYLSAAHTLGIYALQTTFLMAGTVYYHTDELLCGLPAEIDQLDSAALIANPRDFTSQLGHDLTSTLRTLFLHNEITAHTVMRVNDFTD